MCRLETRDILTFKPHVSIDWLCHEHNCSHNADVAQVLEENTTQGPTEELQLYRTSGFAKCEQK